MASFLDNLLSFPMNITIGAYKVATFANVTAAVGVVGSVAAAVSTNQPLLNTAFGNSKGALISLAAIALSHAATTLAAHGDAIGAPAALSSSVKVSGTIAPAETSATVQLESK